MRLLDGTIVWSSIPNSSVTPTSLFLIHAAYTRKHRNSPIHGYKTRSRLLPRRLGSDPARTPDCQFMP